MKKLLPILVVLLFVEPTLAEDFSPPAWDRGDPYAITAAWEFAHDTWPDFSPDGPLTNVDVKGSGSMTTNAAPYNAEWYLYDADGAICIAADEGSGGIDFIVDNVVDLMPVKYIRVQVTHSEGHGSVLSISGRGAYDNEVGGAVFQTPVSVSYVDGHQTLFTWALVPNPDYEWFTLEATGVQVYIDQVVVDTISVVPEPATLGLLLLGGLALLRRRSRTAFAHTAVIQEANHENMDIDCCRSPCGSCIC